MIIAKVLRKIMIIAIVATLALGVVQVASAATTGSPRIVALTGAYLNAPKTTLTVGETVIFSARPNPSNATGVTRTFTSSNNGVATVSSSGLVRAVSSGTARITVRYTQGSVSKFASKNIVVVQNAAAATPARTTQAPVQAQTIKKYEQIPGNSSGHYLIVMSPNGTTILNRSIESHNVRTDSVSATSHRNYCVDCGYQKNIASHSFTQWNDNGNYSYRECVVCHYRETSGVGTGGAGSGHEHSWGNLSTTAYGHYFSCTICGEARYDGSDGFELHSFRNGKCTVCGYKCSHKWGELVQAQGRIYDGVCTICGMEGTVVVTPAPSGMGGVPTRTPLPTQNVQPAMNHPFLPSNSWTITPTAHYKTCTYAGCNIPAHKNPANTVYYGLHTYEPGDANRNVCSVCGYVISAAGPVETVSSRTPIPRPTATPRPTAILRPSTTPIITGAPRPTATPAPHRHVWSKWSNAGPREHIRVCSLDMSHIERRSHTWNQSGKCTACNYQCPHIEFDSSYKCLNCGFVCRHARTHAEYKFRDGTNSFSYEVHPVITYCNVCDKQISLTRAPHSWNDGRCGICGEECPHRPDFSTTSYKSKSYEKHLFEEKCSNCKRVLKAAVLDHTFEMGNDGKYRCIYCNQIEEKSEDISYVSISSSQHTKIVGSSRRNESHKFSDYLPGFEDSRPSYENDISIQLSDYSTGHYRECLLCDYQTGIENHTGNTVSRYVTSATSHAAIARCSRCSRLYVLSCSNHNTNLARLAYEVRSWVRDVENIENPQIHFRYISILRCNTCGAIIQHEGNLYPSSVTLIGASDSWIGTSYRRYRAYYAGSGTVPSFSFEFGFDNGDINIFENWYGYTSLPVNGNIRNYTPDFSREVSL